jgi:hypothetical protein
MASFQFYLQLGKQKRRVGGGRESYYFWSKIPWWKMKCEKEGYRDATGSSLSPKFGALVLKAANY